MPENFKGTYPSAIIIIIALFILGKKQYVLKFTNMAKISYKNRIKL